MNSRLAVLLAVLLFALPLAALAQSEDQGESKGRNLAGYTVHQTVELGGRIVDVAGNRQVYDTFENLNSGPRLLSQDLTMQATPGTQPLFDQLYLESFGFGGDPNDLARLRIHKSGIYDFVGLYRRDKSIFDYNLFANPLTLNNTAFLTSGSPAIPPRVTNNLGQLSPFISNTPQFQSTTRNMGDFSLALFPESVISIRLGFTRNNNQGRIDSTLHESNELSLTNPNYRSRSDRYQFGLDFKGLTRTTISFDQFFEHDINDDNWSDNPYGFSLTVNGVPTAVDPGVALQTVMTMGTSGCLVSGSLGLSNGGVVNPQCNNGTFFYQRSYDVRTDIPTWQLSLESNYFRNLDIVAQAAYSSATSDLRHLNDTWKGLGTQGGYDLYQITGPASTKRVSTSADLGLTYNFTGGWRVSDKFRYLNWHQQGNFDASQLNCYPPAGATLSSSIGAPCPLTALARGLPGPTVGADDAVVPSGDVFGSFTPYSQFIGERSFFNTIRIDRRSSRRMGGFVGYRYGRRELRELDGQTAGTDFITATSGGVDTPVVVPASFGPGGAFRPRLNEHTGLVGVNLLPIDRWRINADAEISYFDNAFTQITPRHQQRFRANTVYALRRWASVNGSVRLIESRNDFANAIGLFPAGDIAPYGHKDHYRYYTAGVSVSPSSRLILDLGYTYLDQKIASASCLPMGGGVMPVTGTGLASPLSALCPVIAFTQANTPVTAGEPTIAGGFPLILDYTERTPSFSGDVAVKPVKRVTLTFGYSITADAGANNWIRGDNGQPLLFPVDRFFDIVAPGSPSATGILPGPNPLVPSGPQTFNWHKPYAGVEVALAEGIALKAKWAYFDYNERGYAGPLVPRSFRANTGTVSLNYAF